MEIISDLHIHSRYSRACSKAIDFANLEKYARIKGLNLLGTSDFFHPLWRKEIDKELVEDDNGILWSKGKFPFLWQNEISLIYTQDGKGRRVHQVILAPNREVVDQITDVMVKRGRVDYDGRPIFGISSIEFVEMMMEISKDIEVIPAHCMTPWFGLFGSKSGFDSLQDCFGDMSKHIHAVETGLSADPPMLWRFLDERINLISTSDTHSFWPWRIGREATVFDCELKYKEILEAIRTGKGLKKTIEVIPDYGKYHYDGHRDCGVSFSPEETRGLKGVCPKCGKELTIGVQYRIEELAKHEEGYKPSNASEFVSLIPLSELIAKVYGMKMVSSKKVWGVFNELINKFGNEFNILMNVSEKELSDVAGVKMAKVIMLNREGKLNVKPGYDGVYGEVELGEGEVGLKKYF
jgi:uncharacterized protein (TIGR00375 family)